jgi:hypothetical protein
MHVLCVVSSSLAIEEISLIWHSNPQNRVQSSRSSDCFGRLILRNMQLWIGEVIGEIKDGYVCSFGDRFEGLYLIDWEGELSNKYILCWVNSFIGDSSIKQLPFYFLFHYHSLISKGKCVISFYSRFSLRNSDLPRERQNIL